MVEEVKEPDFFDRLLPVRDEAETRNEYIGLVGSLEDKDLKEKMLLLFEIGLQNFDENIETLDNFEG